jgi:pyruvate kinase
MLSAETATGAFPVKAVRTMTQIIETVEPTPYDDLPETFIMHKAESAEHALAHEAVHLAVSNSAKLIFVWRTNGSIARFITQLRPQHTRLVIGTANVATVRRLALLWGTEGVVLPSSAQDKLIRGKRAVVEVSQRIIRSKKLAKQGDTVVAIFGKNLVSYKV